MRLNLNAPLNLNTAGVPSMAHMLEQASIRETAPTAITNFDLVGQAIHYYTANATSGSFTVSGSNSVYLQMGDVNYNYSVETPAGPSGRARIWYGT